MNFLINQYSFVIISFVLAAVAGFFLLRKQPTRNNFLAFGVLVAALIVAWVFVHPRQTLLITDAKTVKAAIGAGKPVLLEFQSPY